MIMKKQRLFIKPLAKPKQKFATESIESIKQYVTDAFAAHPEFKMEYFEIAAEDDLIPAIVKENKKYRAFIAIFVKQCKVNR